MHDEDSGTVKVQGFEMTRYESAGLWSDERQQPCLVVRATFEDGEQGMYLLYRYNMVRAADGILEQCQWCIMPES